MGDIHFESGDRNPLSPSYNQHLFGDTGKRRLESPCLVLDTTMLALLAFLHSRSDDGTDILGVSTSTKYSAGAAKFSDRAYGRKKLSKCRRKSRHSRRGLVLRIAIFMPITVGGGSVDMKRQQVILKG